MTSINRDATWYAAFYLLLITSYYSGLPAIPTWYHYFSLGFALLMLAFLGSRMKECEISRNSYFKVMNGSFAYLLALKEEFGT